MTERIEHLLKRIDLRTRDADVFFDLNASEYRALKGRVSEAERKASFLTAFAEKIPVVVDKKELIIGSARFFQAQNDARKPIWARNEGHITVDYPFIINTGIDEIIKMLKNAAGNEAPLMAQTMLALKIYISRHRDEALRLGMDAAAKNCDAILKGRPQTLAQALQLVWFVHTLLHAEGMYSAVSFGRMDMYLFPFYERDIENGVLNEEQAKELFAAFFIKTCEADSSQNLTLGGNNENILTYLLLEVTTELGIKQPSFSARISEGSTEAYFEKIVELIRRGIGQPSLVNDEPIIKGLVSRGISREDAENYNIVGCYEACPQGNALCLTTVQPMFLNLILLDFLENAGQYSDFNEFYSAFKAYFTEYCENEFVEECRIKWEYVQEKCVSPFESACISSCVESGMTAEHCGAKYTLFGLNILGLGTLTDSIYVIKRLCFEENRISLGELIHQVKNNFPDKRINALCRNMQGKYGTDCAETNALARDMSNFIADNVYSLNIDGRLIINAGLFIFLSDIYSADHPATPDGRLNGERLSYGISASDICEGKTVTSVLSSAVNVANHRFANGNPIMFTLCRRDVEGEAGKKNIISLIKGYFSRGGFNLQINVADKDTLVDAQKNPENHKDLTVRISGYSTKFTKVSAQVQNAIIERME